MAKRIKVTVEVEPDILYMLEDLHKQATIERSHFYVASAAKSDNGDL